MKKFFYILPVIFLFTLNTGFAGKYFWVGNGGSWNDYSHHWAVTSGGTTMHSSAPGINDTVYFDAASFSVNNALVHIDTTLAQCAMMDWRGIDQQVEFKSMASDTLRIFGSCYLSGNLSCNFYGLLQLCAPAPVVAEFDFAGLLLRCNIAISADTAFLASDLNAQYNNLYLTAGSFNTNTHKVTCRHFNTNTSVGLMNSVLVSNPSWYGNDTLTITGSMVATGFLAFNQTAPLYFSFNSLDSNYINLGSQVISGDIIMDGSKKMWLYSNLSTQGTIDFNISGQFYSRGLGISADQIISTTALGRMLDLGTSRVDLNGTGNIINLNSQGLYLKSEAADLFVNYAGADTVNLVTGADSVCQFAEIHFAAAPVMIFNSLKASLFAFTAPSEMMLAKGTTFEMDTMTSTGNCGNYTRFSTYCAECPFCPAVTDCDTISPRFISTGGAITAGYLKLNHIRASGALFTANQSFSEGYTGGWVINEPSTPTTLYWISGSGNWNDPAHWSVATGGLPGICIPDKMTNVVFDAASGINNDTVLIEGFAYCHKMTWNGTTGDGILTGQGTVIATDSVRFSTNTHILPSLGFRLSSGDGAAHTLTSNGADIRCDIYIDKASQWVLTDTLYLQGIINLQMGTFDLNGHSLRCDAFISEGSKTRSFDYSSSQIFLKGNETIWRSTGAALTLLHANSTVNEINQDPDYHMIDAGGMTFDTLSIQSPRTRISGGTNCTFISLKPGILLECEPLKTILFDSLSADGQCDNPITLSAYNESSDTAIFKMNNSADTLTLTNVILKNVCADTTAQRVYYAVNSIGINKFFGWTITPAAPATAYYWAGNISKNWHTPGNWRVGGFPATCLPGPADTVIFSSTALNAAGSHDTVEIMQNAYCNSMIWKDSIIGKPTMVLGGDLIATGSVTLCDSLFIIYTSDYQPTNPLAPEFTFMPQGGRSDFDPVCRKIAVNLSIQGRSISDTVILTNNLIMDSMCAVTFLSGTFDAGQKEVLAGIFISLGNTPKNVCFANSNLTAIYEFSAQKSTVLDLDMNASHLVLGDNSSFNNKLTGGNQTFADVELRSRETALPGVHYTSVIEDSNAFGILRISPGIYLKIKAGSVQTLDSLIAKGTCADSIFIVSSQSGNPAFLKKTTSDSLRGTCLNLKDITATNGGSALFSKNLGNCTNWFFDPARPTSASFNLPLTTCYQDSIHFINTSTVYSGSTDQLLHTWIFGDNDTSTAENPVHLYNNNIEYTVDLYSIDTVTGCSDHYAETFQIYKPQVNLSTSETDLAICLGQPVTFSAFTADSGSAFQFIIEGDTALQSQDSTWLTTDSLQDGDDIYVMITYHGCIDTSSHYTFTVYDLPVIDLDADDADLIICQQDTVIFNGTGGDEYQLSYNGATYGSTDTTSSWSFGDITNGDTFSLYGQDTTNGCSSRSDTLIFVVNPLPVATLVSSEADLTICAGNTVFFTASNTSEYQFFINGDSLGTVSAVSTLTLSSLVNGDVISIEGTSASGCSAFSSDILEFTVNPTPTVILTGSDADNLICQGESVTFQASGADTYQFYINSDSTGPFDFANSFTSTAINLSDTITVTGLLGECPAAATTPVIMDVRPTITLDHTISEICDDDTIHFTGHGDVQYQYFVNGNPVTAMSSDSVYHAFGLSNGQQVTIAGTPGACVPSPLAVTIYPLPVPVMVCSDPDTSICQGSFISFTASGAEQYAFYLSGIQVMPFSGIYNYSTDTLTDGTIVTLQALSSHGCAGLSADTFNVTVRPNPVVSFVQTDADQILCAGDTVTFTAAGASQYEFFISGASQGPASVIDTLTTSSLNNGAVVSVVGTTANCPATSLSTYSFIVNPLPIVGFSPISPINYCNGDTLVLLATGGTSYEYYVDGISTGAPSGNNFFTSASLTNGQTVSVTGYLTGCRADADTSYTVSVNNYPVINFTNNQTGAVCYGDTVTFVGSGAQNYVFYLDETPVSYDSLFTTSDLEQGQSVVLMGGNGVCWITADTIYQLDINFVDVQLSSSQPFSTLCSGDAITFNATGADSYQFFIDGIAAGPSSASGIYTPPSLSDGQVVSVTGTSTLNGCTQQALGDYLVHVYPAPAITVTPATTFCDGDSALLQSSVGGLLQWYLDGVLIPEMSSQNFYANESGNYQVIASAGGDSISLSAGANFYGQLGDNTLVNSLNFREAQNLDQLTEIACGAEFTLAITGDGTAKSWGRNEFGALGTGNFTNSSIPVTVGNLSTAMHIGAGQRHGLTVLTDSTVLAWGDNTFGQLGLGNYATSNYPFAVTGLTGIADVAAGDNFCLALTGDGHVWAWGQNQYGQLGDGSNVNSNLPLLVNGLDDVVAIRAGGNHSMALKSDGSLWVWGANSTGQLATGDYTGSSIPLKVNLPIGVISFDGGAAHSIAADSAGHVYCWGDNTFGQIGNNTTTTALYPVKINEAGQARIVRAGQYNSFVVRSDENVYSWGLNNQGQLGQQNLNIVQHPEAALSLFGISGLDAGNAHVAAISAQTHSCASSPVLIHADTVPPVTVFLQGLTLYTTTPGAQFQWYYNGSPVPGATDSTLLIAAHGLYWVAVTFANGCTGYSEGYDYQSGIDNAASADGYSVYPNPSNGTFTIQFAHSTLIKGGMAQITLVNMLGQIIHTQMVGDTENPVIISLKGISPGMYIIEIQLNDEQLLRKPIIIN